MRTTLDKDVNLLKASQLKKKFKSNQSMQYVTVNCRVATEDYFSSLPIFFR